MSSFPKHSCFYKLIASLIILLILSSMATIVVKKCHLVAIPEDEFKQIRTNEQKLKYIDNYFTKLHVLHSIALICGSVILLLSFIDFVSHFDEDLNFAFHLISVYVFAIIAFLTIYASYVALEKPCISPPDSTCCTLLSAPQLFAPSDRHPVTAFTLNDWSMIAVVVMDGMTALLLLVTSFKYFIDLRSDAKRSGYLSRVHNSSYLTRI